MDKYLIKIRPMTRTTTATTMMMVMMTMIITTYCKWKLQQNFLHFLSVTQYSYTNYMCHGM